MPIPEKKVKGVIHWVSKEHAVPAIVNQYAVLMNHENVLEQARIQKCDFTDFFNHNSLIKYENARVWDIIADSKEFDRF